ncbi:MAG TPA: hypothetical protein VNL74_11755 [Methylococcus sp.]|nr:hypothetical protein [Methylococcus sp.]
MSAVASAIRKPKETRPGSIAVCVSDQGNPVVGAYISVYAADEALCHCADFDPCRWEPREDRRIPDTPRPTKGDGCVTFGGLPPAIYVVTYDHYPEIEPQCVEVESGCIKDVCFKLGLNAMAKVTYLTDDCRPLPCPRPRVGDRVDVGVEFTGSSELRERLSLSIATPGYSQNPGDRFSYSGVIVRPGPQAVDLALLLPWRNPFAASGVSTASAEGFSPARLLFSIVNDALERISPPITGNLGVTLRRSQTHPTGSQALWVAIRNRTRAISFSGSGYKDFIDRVLCRRDFDTQSRKLNRQLEELGDHVYGTAAYDLLKTATEVFLLLECGVVIEPRGVADRDTDRLLFDTNEEAGRLDQSLSLADIQAKLTDYLGPGRLPYINRVIKAAFPGDTVGRVHCDGVLTSRVDGPCLLELIWNYWHEEGMLVQSINAISRRFQNVRAPGERDPLAHLEIDPLRPLNNIFWGYIEDERNRLSVKRRAYEYQHQYGLGLYGKAVPDIRPADSRSKFLEAFHNLLHLCAVFFKEDNDTTIIADGYPLLNALKEVHLILAQGAHNQFGDLPWTARVEMLIQQWLMARPEIRDFLQSRAMVPYKEAWMPQVDTMKTLQGWSDVTVTHFHDLGEYGELILLSIRYHDWIGINDEDEAKNWARYFRPEIQGYLHAYRAVTGVDLTNPDMVDYTLPSVHLRKRLAMQQRAR